MLRSKQTENPLIRIAVGNQTGITGSVEISEETVVFVRDAHDGEPVRLVIIRRVAKLVRRVVDDDISAEHARITNEHFQISSCTFLKSFRI